MAAAAIDGRQRRAAERREEMRERLLQAALAVFTEQGYHAGTTKAIAQRAGVADGLLFHYFPTKADLMAAVADRSAIGAEMRRVIADMAGQPVAQALPAMAHQWFRILRHNRSLVRVLIEQAHADPRVHAALKAHGEQDGALLAAYLQARIAAGELRPIDPMLAARVVFQTLFGLAMLCDGTMDGAEEQMLDGQIDLLLHGMLASSSGDASAPDRSVAASPVPGGGQEN